MNLHEQEAIVITDLLMTAATRLQLFDPAVLPLVRKRVQSYRPEEPEAQAALAFLDALERFDPPSTED